MQMETLKAGEGTEAKSGDRVMYGDSLRAYGFALDSECKNNPSSSLLNAATKR